MTSRSEGLLTTLQNRRSIYHLTKDIPLSHEEVQAVVKRAVRASFFTLPDDSAATARALILFGAEHNRLWEMVKTHLAAVTTDDKAEAGIQKITNFFQTGAGTVLFFRDTKAEAAQQGKMSKLGYAEVAQEEAAAMATLSSRAVASAEFAAWLALSESGIGASLQHYSPLIDADVLKAFQLPPWWALHSQMPFGGVGTPAGEKTMVPMGMRCKVIGQPKEG